MLDEIERSGEPEATTLPPALNNNRVRAAASQLATFWRRAGERSRGGGDARLSHHVSLPTISANANLSASAKFLRLRKRRRESSPATRKVPQFKVLPG